MANDNNNINSLAIEISDADTDELEILSVDLIPTDEELEQDADTHSLEQNEPEARSVESLKSDLESRDERITSLQFDIEQLRTRWAGLEKEIEVREELTDMLRTDLKAAHKKLAASVNKVTRLQRQVDELESQLPAAVHDQTDGDDELAQLEERLIELTDRAANDAERIQTLEAKLESVESRGPGSGAAGDTQANKLAAKVAQQTDALSNLQWRYERQGEELRDARSARGRLDAMLKVAVTENADLKSRHSAARRKNDNFGRHQELDRQLIAEQRGLIAGYADKLRRVEDRLARSEAYADGLRRKYIQASEQGANLRASLAALNTELSDSRNTIESLETLLDAAREDVRTLEVCNEEQRTSYEQEVTNLRAELAGARETIASRDALNKQLEGKLSAGDSIRNEMAAEAESLQQDHERKIEQRETQIASFRKTNLLLEQALEAAEGKIANKDNAISALLNELAHKSRAIESIGEIENVIHDIDGRMSERIEVRSDDGEVSRTRLLIGRLDGQEMRFPLFKNRLTIGRTNHNDIQLRTPHISRRHAVILVDQDVARIVDWGSKNGVFVNSSRVSEKALSSGDVIGLGLAEFIYEERPEHDPA